MIGSPSRYLPYLRRVYGQFVLTMYAAVVIAVSVRNTRTVFGVEIRDRASARKRENVKPILTINPRNKAIGVANSAVAQLYKFFGREGCGNVRFRNFAFKRHFSSPCSEWFNYTVGNIFLSTGKLK